MPANKLPSEFIELSDMNTSSRGVVVLYGRRTDGSLVALKTADDGTLASGVSVSATATLAGTANSYYTDQASVVLSGVYAHLTFGFSSFNITIINDDAAQVIEYSFNGVAVHGKLKVGESVSMDFRAQPGVYLKTVSGSAADYRVSVY